MVCQVVDNSQELSISCEQLINDILLSFPYFHGFFTVRRECIHGRNKT
nr:MAG TPA: hypothetical protein [Inoviridae sp.]